jgi:hypothetical protein
LASLNCFGQSAQSISIKGNVTNSAGNPNLYQVIVVNERTSEGTIATAGGLFSINALQTDTVLFSASGFGVKKVCFHDSVYKTSYSITVKLDSLHLNLAMVNVYPTKSLRQIDEDKNNLGVKNTDKYKNTHLLSSPITNLFERFSRMEESKREVAELEDEEKRRQVLKDMLHLFVKADIINMDDTQFDTFINYLNFSDNFIKTSTDYDLLMAIKYKYEAYENANSYYIPPKKQ